MACRRSGTRLNTMTLAPLALAVRILVDDAEDVTIENINYHLEHGEDASSRRAPTARTRSRCPHVSMSRFASCPYRCSTPGGVARYLLCAAVRRWCSRCSPPTCVAPLCATLAKYGGCRDHSGSHEQGPQRRLLDLSQHGLPALSLTACARLPTGCSSAHWCRDALLASPFSAPWRSPHFLLSSSDAYRRARTRFLPERRCRERHPSCTCALFTGARIDETATPCDRVDPIPRETVIPRTRSPPSSYIRRALVASTPRTPAPPAGSAAKCGYLVNLTAESSIRPSITCASCARE